MNANAALSFVRGALQRFYDLGPKILDLQHKAALVSAKAGQAGNLELQRAAKASVVRIGALLRGHQDVINRWERIAPGLTEGRVGAIVIPIAIAGVVIAIAIAMSTIFRRVTAEERALSLLERGDINAKEAAEIVAAIDVAPPPSPFAQIGKTAQYVVMALVAWGAYRAFQDR